MSASPNQEAAPVPNRDHCVQCGSPLPANWPKGLCSRCALEGALQIENSESKPIEAVQPSTLNLQPSTTSETSGTRIGRYKLLEQIGEGGFGVVWMAEQEEPVRRRVALKIIKLGMDTKQVIARFEAERQALAMMDHPNIARALDAGATETGRPYFVMELVKGIKITEYCDQNNLPTRERLDLFIKVCQAIQHAHQKGIIHRDIKPSNVLVTLHDGAPVAKVIDFGIAKATEGRLTDKTLFTSFQQFIGTPAYVSPEQAEMSGLDIDTRSDIYSLGVLLYELLTGQTPFDTKELINSGLDAIRKTLREVEPQRPSTRLSTMVEGELSATARHRHTDAPKLIRLLRGELDWIVMKTLEKDRTRRYETANGLAMDIQRHLNNESVVASPPNNFYRFQKLVRRNKLAFFAATSVTTALILGLGASSWMFLKERQAYRRARAAEETQSALRREAETGRMRAEARETALLYWKAFNGFPSLGDKESQALAYGKGKGMTSDELAALAARYDGAFKLIRRGAKIRAGCEWGGDLADERWIPSRPLRLRTARQAAQVRARVALAQGRSTDACEDLLATFILGRNIGVNGDLVSVMIQAGFERDLVEFVGENCFRFTPETLAMLSKGIEDSPERNNVSQAISTEKIGFADWIIRQEEGLRVAAGGDEQKALAAITELLRSCVADEAEKIVQAAGNTSAGVIAYTRGVIPVYGILQSLASASPQNLAGETKQAATLIEGSTNLLARLMIPNVGKARGREIETLARLAMLRAAVAYRHRGMAGLNSVRDPFGDGPFELHRVEGGFELRSKLNQFGLDGQLVFVEKDTSL